MNKILLVISPAIALLPATASLAHSGPRVWLGSDAGAIVTYASDNDLAPTSYVPSRVFQATLSPSSGVLTTSFPGYEARRDEQHGLAAGTVFGFQLAGPLLWLDPAAERLVTTAAAMGVARGGGAVTSGTGVTDGFEFFGYNAAGDHAHLAYTLLGDGFSPTAAAPEGTYVLPLRLTSSTLGASPWYFLVLGHNASDSSRDRATALAGLMRDARAGDANFDGNVNFVDLLALARSYGTPSGAWWANGDFDFDGAVNFTDLLSLARNYGGANLQADWALAQAMNVPEPVGTLAGAAVMLLAPAGRRRRRRG